MGTLRSSSVHFLCRFPNTNVGVANRQRPAGWRRENPPQNDQSVLWDCCLILGLIMASQMEKKTETGVILGLYSGYLGGYSIGHILGLYGDKGIMDKNMGIMENKMETTI